MAENGPAGLLRLSRANLKPASITLARAFQYDPQVMYYVPEAARRKDLLPHIFEFFIRYGLFHGEVYASSPALEGVAIWLPDSKARVTLWRAFLCGGVLRLCPVGMGVIRRMRRSANHICSIRERHAPFPHLYLQVIGVDPAFQGKGHAGRLLSTRLDRLDQERLPCWVETQNGKNVPMYERFGFRCVEEGIMPGTDVKCWSMLRAPA